MESEKQNFKWHKIYDKIQWIEDVEKEIMHIPLIDQLHNVVGYTIVDLKLKDMLLQFCYYLFKNNFHNKQYAMSNTGNLLHYIVMGDEYKPGHIIDHRNGDGLLNVRDNLRNASRNLNGQNKPKAQGTSSKYIGVHFRKDRNKWKCSISYKGERYNLGTFDIEDEIKAAKMYDIYATYFYKDEEGDPMTNGLLTREEMDSIKENGIPEQYKLGKNKELPDNIYLTKYGTYRIRIIRKYREYSRTAKTLEDAIILKAKMIEEIEQNIKEEEAKDDKEPEKITRNEDGEAIITMSNGLACIVDDDVWHDVNQFSWNCAINEKGNFSHYPCSTINGVCIFLHRYIYEKYKGEIPKDMTVDHKNSKEILNAKLDNLRLATMSLQNHNKDKDKNRCPFDEYRGIYFNGVDFVVYISKTIYGHYETAEEAAEKANEVYISIYGDDAHLNVIDWSKKTTKHNRIPEELINEELIRNLVKLVDLENIMFIKKLTLGTGGDMTTRKLTKDTFDEYKQLVINKLYYQDNSEQKEEEIITEEQIRSTKTVTKLREIVKKKKLNVKNGGPITVEDIHTSNLEEYKQLIIDILFYSSDKKTINLETLITKDYIMGLTQVCDLENVIKAKKLNSGLRGKNGGSIIIGNIKPSNLEQYKQIVIDMLYPDNKSEKINPEENSDLLITKEYIMGLTTVYQIKEVIRSKKLNVGMKGGKNRNDQNYIIKMGEIHKSNIEHYKEMIINILYPS